MEHPKHLQDRIAKQPKWVQQYMDKLLADIEYWQESVLPAEKEESAIYWYIAWEDRRYMPSDSFICFELKHCTIECRIEDNKLCLRRINRHGNRYSFTIEPQTSNLVQVS